VTDLLLVARFDHTLEMPAALPFWPRGLREELAAQYIGLSVTTFRREWREGRAPRPIQLTVGRQVWLRDELDRWLDGKAGVHNDLAPIEALVDEWNAACDVSGRSAVP
jgi:predicted DNA-binding transcriptional regulator AlpA